MHKVRVPGVGAVSRRAGTVTAAIVGVLAVAVSAYGWVSAQSPTGHGAVSTGEPLDEIEVAGPNPIVLTLDQPVDLAGSLINDNTFRISVAKIKVTITGIRPRNSPCIITPGVNFFLTDAVPPPGEYFTADGRSAPGFAGIGDWQGGKIEFRSSPDFDQTACLNTTLSVRYTAIAP